MTPGLDEMGPESWQVYRKLVLHELVEMQATLKEIAEHLVAIDKDISALKIKAGIFGLLGGALPTIAALVYLYLEKK